MNTQTNPWIGQLLLGRYQVLSLLKEGGMAALYLALDLRTQQQVVLKTPRPELLADQEFLGRFAREILALTKFIHPNIVPILDSGDHQGRPFFVLKYMPKGTLRNRQPQDAGGKALPITLDTLVVWLGPIAAALDFVHSQNLIHRDVKPDNILFDNGGVPFLCDFGILKLAAEGPSQAEFATQYTRSGLIIGTPQYMAPELIQGERGDGKADQFSLGITLYELLAGQPPIPNSSPAMVLANLLRKNYPPLEQVVRGLPRELTDAVARATATDRNQRFPNCREFAKAVMQGARLESSSRRPASDVELVVPQPTPRSTPASASKPVLVTPIGPALVQPIKPPSRTGTGMARVTCPSCGVVYELPRSDSPRSVACSHCSEVFEVIFRAKPLSTPPPPVSQAQVETPPAQMADQPTPVQPAKRAVRGNSRKASAEDLPVAELDAPGFGFPWRFLLKTTAFLIFLAGLGVGGWYGYQWLMVYMADSRIKQSTKHLGSGNYPDALQAADSAVKFRPAANSYYQRGRIRLMMLDYFGAFDDFNLICEEIDPAFAPAYAYRAEVRMRLQFKNEKPSQRKEALSDVEKALSLNKNLGYAYAVKGWMLALDKDGIRDVSQDVEEAFRKAKEFSATDPDMLLLRGEAHASLNNTNEFEQDMREAGHYAAKKPAVTGNNSAEEQYDENRAVAARGLLYCRPLGNVAEASVALGKLAQVDYFFRPLLEGEIAFLKGDYKFAVEQFEIVLRSSPHASSVYYDVADCFMRQGGKLNLDVAETRATEGLNYCPKSAALYAKRGEIRAALKHYEEAVADYDMALKLNGEYTLAKSQREDALKKAQADRPAK